MEDIELEFSNKLAPYISENQWHSTQEIRPSKDGGIHLLMKVSVTPELVRWVLGFGAGVRVKSSESLKEQLRIHLNELKEFY